MINTFDVKAGETRTNSTLYGLNRFETAKKTGANGENEYADLLVLLNGLFENQLARGIRTEDDFDSYMATFPNGKTPFIYPHKGLDRAHKIAEQDNNAALLKRESVISQAQPVRKLGH